MSADGVLDVALVKKDFPLLDRVINGHRIVYLDTAASSLPPHAVVEAMASYYETTHANVHRGVYATAEEATHLFEGARSVIGRFIGAPEPTREIVFTKNTTESINLLAGSWGSSNLHEGDAVVLSIMEHHANIVPWQMLAERIGFEIRWIGVDSDFRLDLDELDVLLDGAKLLSVTAVSNVLGTINPIAELAARAHAAGALIHVDGAQSVPHASVNVTELDIDFLSFSGHKMLGPTGIGVLWGRAGLLASMPPFLGGGGMILDVRTDRFLAAEAPQRFEAGTPPIAAAIGLAAAVRYLEGIGMDKIREHEISITTSAMTALTDRFGEAITVHGPSAGTDRGGVISFTLGDVHAHDIAQILDSVGVCVRPGHHCAKPLMRHLGVPATARASFGLYNDLDDVAVLVDGLEQAAKLFA
ncbi:MAG: SufS family cysteine desulfurase [Actinomycetes bacterium]